METALNLSPLPAKTLPGARVDPLDRARLWIVLTTIAVNVIGVAALTLAPWSDWRSAVAINLIDNALLLGFVVWRRDDFLARMIVFGLAAGFVELLADAWLVQYTRTLDYSPGGGPMLFCSPFWMPFAWEVVSVQLAYLGLRLHRRFGAAGLVAVGVVGAVNIPYYEQMARSIHWWNYRGCRLLLDTPYYIVIGEFGIAIALTLLARRVIHDRRWAVAAGMGALGGVAIFVCYAVAHGVTDQFARATL